MGHTINSAGDSFPGDMLYEDGLHEAMHTLYGAETTETGLMCHAVKRYCYHSPLHDGIGIRKYALRLRPVDAEVFTLYGLLPHGMSRDEAAGIIQIR